MKRFFAIMLIFCLLCVFLTSCDLSQISPLATEVPTETSVTNPTDTTASSAEATTVSTTTGGSLEEPEEPQMHSKELYVGYGRKNISPRCSNGSIIPVPLEGYAEERICDKILSELYASCTAFRDAEGNTALLYSIDNIGIPTEDIDYTRNMINEATGVPVENIVLNSTHTHYAPKLGVITSKAIKTYREIFFKGIVDAGKSALEDLTLCTELYVGAADGTGYNFVRRYNTDKYGNPISHIFEGDHFMPIARFVRGDEKEVILVNWAAHADTVSTTNYKNVNSVSSDYIGAFRDIIERRVDAYVSIHIAAGGDMNPFSKIPGEFTFPGTDNYGKALGGKVISALDTLDKVEIVSSVKMLTVKSMTEINHSKDYLLNKAQEIYDLSERGASANTIDAKCREYGIINLTEAKQIILRAGLPVAEEVPLWALSIGNIAFGIAPYEMFSKTGIDIKEASPFELTFICGYSNGKYSYMPADYAFERLDYEVYVCRYPRGTAEKFQGEISQMIDALYKDIYGD